jgi:UDP-glucose 4-epimerase
VARAFYLSALSKHTQEIYNLGGGNPQTINKLVELLEGEVVHIPKRPGEPDCTWANIEKICKHLNWKPTISFEQGIGKILNEIDYWKDAPLWDPTSIEAATKTWFNFLTPGATPHD